VACGGDTCDRRREFVATPDHCGGNGVIATVPCVNFSDALVEGEPFAVWTARRVRRPEHIVLESTHGFELGAQVNSELHADLMPGVRVMGDELADDVVPFVRAQVTSSVERMKASGGNCGRVSDVVEPRGRNDA
jgi:hypothetical protein